MSEDLLYFGISGFLVAMMLWGVVLLIYEILKIRNGESDED